jgi:uncharacterized membrane protein
MTETERSTVTAGTLLGAGLGGFVDGILFHQLLQVHNMLTGRLAKDSIANVEINMFWDGVFHAGTWAMTAVGLWWLVKAGARAPLSKRLVTGGLALGWGLFNLIEGVIDHHLLHLHHVVERLGVSVFDWLFLAAGVALIIAGCVTIRAEVQSRRPRVAPAGGALPRPS